MNCTIEPSNNTDRKKTKHDTQNGDENMYMHTENGAKIVSLFL